MEQPLHYRDVINFLISKFQYKSYLELGVRDPNNTFNKIECELKEGVDINPSARATYTMSTDEFFSTVGKNKTWDIIFIDADHNKDQVLVDFENSLARLSENGTIVMDDVNPTQPWLLSPEFCNNAWETFVKLTNRNDLVAFSILGTYVGVVRRGNQKPHGLKIESSYQFLDKYRTVLTKPITFSQLQFLCQ